VAVERHPAVNARATIQETINLRSRAPFGRNHRVPNFSTGALTNSVAYLVPKEVLKTWELINPTAAALGVG
jgi:hypothetical protein